MKKLFYLFAIETFSVIAMEPTQSVRFCHRDAPLPSVTTIKEKIRNDEPCAVKKFITKGTIFTCVNRKDISIIRSINKLDEEPTLIFRDMEGSELNIDLASYPDIVSNERFHISVENSDAEIKRKLEKVFDDDNFAAGA